jgi:hypothetical protein
MPIQLACPLEPASAPELLVMCPRMEVPPLASIDRDSTKVSVPARPPGASPVNTASMRPETAALEGSRMRVSVQFVEPFHVPVQRLVPVHTIAPVPGSSETTCHAHAPTGSVQRPRTLDAVLGPFAEATTGAAASGTRVVSASRMATVRWRIGRSLSRRTARRGPLQPRCPAPVKEQALAW